MNERLNEYRNFIEKFFPCSGVINNNNVELVYFRVCENNIVTDIYEKYIPIKKQEKNISCHLEFLKRYRIHFNNLLLYIPINECNCINFCLRAMVENLLKFLYSVYFDGSLNSITVCKFRDIKEGLNKLETNIFIDKVEIQRLLSYYGKFSNSIHDKNFDNKTQLDYMESIIRFNQLDLEELDSNLINILNIYEVFVGNIFEISERTLSIGEALRLKNTVSVKRFNKIKQHFFLEN
ncbi:hypothetical protein [Clostridium cadaveris]